MAEYIRVLKYPLLVWFLSDTLSEALAHPALVPGLANIQDSFTGATLAAVAIGAWVGYKMIELKGNWFNAMVAGLISGAWCGLIAVTEGGIDLTPPSAYGLAFGGTLMSLLPLEFAWLILNVIGAVIGTGFALTRRSS